MRSEGYSPNPVGWMALEERDLSLPTSMHQGKAIRGHSERTVVCNPRRESLPDNKPTDTLSWTFSLQNCEK